MPKFNPGDLIDITIKGAKVVTDDPFDTTATYELTTGGTEHIRLRAEGMGVSVRPAGEQSIYEQAYWNVQSVLDQAIGSDDDSGTGMGIAQDVALLAQRYADLRRAVLAVESPAHWRRVVAEIESADLRDGSEAVAA